MKHVSLVEWEKGKIKSYRQRYRSVILVHTRSTIDVSITLEDPRSYIQDVRTYAITRKGVQNARP